jgi:2-keto-3-deoxy-L-rhamnonate aldolase RhmA
VFGAASQAQVLDEKRDQVLAAARKHGKTCAMLVNSPEQLRQWKQAGVTLLAYSSDVEALHGGFSRAMKTIKG